MPTRSVVDHATADSGPPAAVGTTDNKGQVNLRAGKKFKFKFKFVDDYGEPIPNLIVALVSEDKRWGVVLVNDPLDRFPPKMVILHGKRRGLREPELSRLVRQPARPGSFEITMPLGNLAEGIEKIRTDRSKGYNLATGRCSSWHC